MFGIRAVFLLSLVINVLVHGYQENGNLDGELEVLLKRLQKRLEDEERGHELEHLLERGFGGSVSGVGLDLDALEKYNELKKENGVYKWITLKIDKESNQIVVDKTDVARGIGEDEAQFNEMKDELTSGPRYVVFKFVWKKDGSWRDGIVLIKWYDSDNSKQKDQLNYATSATSMKKKFKGFNFEFEADTKGDLDYETLLRLTSKENNKK